MSIEQVIPSNYLIFCHPLLLLPLTFHSIRVFSSELALRIRWPKFWSFSFSINPSSEYSGLISFMIHWFDFLTVQGTLKSFLQHRSSKLLVLHSAFFMVQLSHPYMATRELEKPDLPPEEVHLGERNRASHVGILKKHNTSPPLLIPPTYHLCVLRVPPTRVSPILG